ncbi:MAG: hypothetical protein ACQERU_10240 [Bacteroidota bacterium]
MKKILLFAGILFFVNISVGQTIKKGNVIGTHVLEVELKPEVTIEEWQNFYAKNVLTDMSKYFKGWEAYLMKGIRGENKNEFGVLFIIQSEKHRDSYYKDDGSLNEVGQEIMKKFQPVLDELEKLGTSTFSYTDWIVIE